LYYRLNVFPIRVPPLRERREDIPLLVEHLVQKCARRMGRSITSIPKKTMDALIAWEWPGNVRELENFIERSVILTQGSVLVSPLNELQPITRAEKSVDETLAATERQHILRALRDSHGKVGGPQGAAARLGLKRTTLQSKPVQNQSAIPTDPALIHDGQRRVEMTVHASAVSDFLYGVIGDQNHDRADDGHAQAIDVDAGYSVRPKETKEPSAHDRADDSEDDVEEETFSRLVDNLASDKTCNQTQYDPRQD
jgi:transcriptional regulator with AAA-type ATPase domain